MDGGIGSFVDACGVSGQSCLCGELADAGDGGFTVCGGGWDSGFSADFLYTAGTGQQWAVGKAERIAGSAAGDVIGSIPGGRGKFRDRSEVAGGSHAGIPGTCDFRT